MRWLPEASPARALAAVVVVGLLAVAGDVVIMSVYLRSDTRFGLLAVVAVAASLVRSGCALVAARHATVLRRRLADRTGPDAGR